MPHKKTYRYSMLTFLLMWGLTCAQTPKANELIRVHNVSDITEINTIASPPLGAIIYNIAEGKLYTYSGANWDNIQASSKSLTSNDGTISITNTASTIDLSSNDNGTFWLINGNSNTTAAQFLGTSNDQKLELRSNNLPLLQLGRRQTLGLTQAFADYDNNDQPLVHFNGDGNTAAIQFASSAALFYKPMFFTTTNGSFRLKGSAGITDFFEIGSGGPGNDGRLEFIIGDDGLEPIIFKRFDYRNGTFHTELFRVQASSNTEDAKPRFGININPQQIPIDTDYDDSQAAYAIANSTLQIGGSLSLAIISTTANLILTEEHYTIIISGNHDITLPNATSCIGRIYVLKNTSNSDVSCSQYIGDDANTSTNIRRKRVYILQSDGSNWQQINKD